ncbi:MAG: hypothetical protein Q9160_003925 [Pyrenula sp. 1 TL-2023]
MFVSHTLAFLALSTTALAQNTATSASDVYAAQATAKTNSPTSHVPGQAFDRIAIIWLENTDYDKAVGDPSSRPKQIDFGTSFALLAQSTSSLTEILANLAYLASKGITLSNYFGVTHPSEPNYVAAIGGDNFGMDNDNFNAVPSNVYTVIDLLEAGGISWSAYQEDLPYSGFEGFSWVNQQTGANDYVRKHNPPVIYDSVADKPDRLANIKNMTLFQEDLKNDKIPQWSFITPNMTSDGHDTSVTTAGVWTRAFLEPLLEDENFMNNTLVLITFDENHTYTVGNRVLGILLGDAVPEDSVGSTDTNFYNHYSEISTVEANWNLNTLGRWDTGANVFSMVASKTGEEVRTWDAVTGSNPSVFLNTSYAGKFNSKKAADIPAPKTDAIYAGRSVLPEIIATSGQQGNSTIYNTGVQIPDGMHPPLGMSAS